MKRSQSIFAITIIFCILITSLRAQNKSSLDTITYDHFANYLEEIAESSEEELDYNDLYQDYINLFNNPVNINSSNIDILKDLYLINMQQLILIKEHIANYGPIFSKYQLSDIIGLDQESINRIIPAIVYGKPKLTGGSRISYDLRRVNHEILFRISRFAEEKAGFAKLDSNHIKPGSTYLGDPYNIYLRYGFKAGERIRLGVTLDKDAGEMLPFQKVSDTVNNMLAVKKHYMPDFFSLYASFENVLFLSNITIGDFHAEFGQGLTLWSGLSFGKSSNGTTVQKYGRGIRPNTSANENRYLRGISTSLEVGKIEFTSFFSSNKIDANTSYAKDELVITSFQESGLHRTVNELNDKRCVRLNIYGGNINLRVNDLSIGLTATYSGISTTLNKSDKVYKLYSYSGNKIINTGVDFVFVVPRLTIYGEAAYSSNTGWAIITGIDTYLNERLTLMFNYHNYDKNYFSFLNNPIQSGSNASGENGFYIGYNALISKRFILSGYFDFVKYHWLRYQSIMPDMNVNQYVNQLIYNLNNSSRISFRYRYKKSYNDLSINNKYTNSTKIQSNHDIRFSYKHNIHNSLFLTTRIYYSFLRRNADNTDNGYLLSQNIKVSSKKIPLTVNLNFSIFDISDYSTRIYNYENDVLYSFSVPAYFGKGQRWYLLIKFKLLKSMSMWFRVARTTYFDRTEIGSGSELISGSSKTEVKFQTIIKL